MRRDFLGSILGTGIERSKVGDIILLGETGAQILVAAELVEHFEQSLTQVPLLHSSLSSSAHTCCQTDQGCPHIEIKRSPLFP